MRRILFLTTFFIFCFAHGSKIDDANKIVERIVAEKAFSGVVSVFTDDEVLFQRSVGPSRPGARNTIELDDVFRIGSLTKEFTAYLVLDAVARREISIESTISDFFPSEGAFGATTLKQVLNHSAGLPNQSVYSNYFQKPCVSANNSDLRSWLKQLTVDSSKKGKFNYSNTGYSLLACILERKTKLRFDELLKMRIFKPLKMNLSGTAWSNKQNFKVVVGMSKNDELVDFDTSSYFGAGDIVSNVPDLIKWQKRLNNSQIFKKMLSDLLPGKDGWKYGYGVIVDSYEDHPYYWTSGNTPGFVSELAWLPTQKLGIVILSNRKDFPVRQNGSRPLSSEIFDIFTGKKPAFALPILGK